MVKIGNEIVVGYDNIRLKWVRKTINN